MQTSFSPITGGKNHSPINSNDHNSCACKEEPVLFARKNLCPAGFTAADKQRLTDAYIKMVNEQIVPTFQRLADFMKKEYLPKARATSNWSTAGW